MTVVAPFQGLRYDAKKISDPAQVVIPPYDVISPAEQEEYYQTNPFNMVRLELGRTTPEDGESNNAHTRAAACLREWVRQGVLVRDELPAIYYYELDYSLSPLTKLTRNGFICALRLEEFGAGSVLPHERTFQAAKDERLGLMLSCGANFSPVFSIYSDPGGEVEGCLRNGKEADPATSFTDRQGLTHRMWRVTDLDTLRRVKDLMSGRSIFIADGHHRYETALNYRTIQRRSHPNAGARASFEYIMMYLSNLNQEGLTILPTHRLLRNLGEWDPAPFLSKAQSLFEILRFEPGGAGEASWRACLEEGTSLKETRIGFCCPRAGAFHVLKARKRLAAEYLSAQGLTEILQGLDVVVLDRIILRDLVGLPDGYLSDAKNIQFSHDSVESVAMVRSGACDAGFLVNPTRVEQVQAVASAGLVMPHKSTYFYPKVGSGMVVRTLSPGEDVLW
ncbi:MAG: DUF1015 domain-containing protein [Desulfobacteraceae bacterium]|nr:DUF1015 domain-containing protein [Desulfobacteraceae bacterium]